EVALVIDGIDAALPRGIVEERRVVVLVAYRAVKLDVEASGEQRRVRFPRALSDGQVPIRTIDEVIGDRRLGPEQQVEAGAVLESPGQGEQLSHHAVLSRPVPFLPEPFVRLDQSYRAELAKRQRSDAPRPVAPRENHRREHRDQGPPPDRPARRSPRPTPEPGLP